MRHKILILIAIAAILAALSAFYRRQRTAAYCHFDNNRIQRIYEVDVITDGGDRLRFCSVYCAHQWWTRHPGEAAELLVTDEVAGKMIDAQIAVFVESSVVTDPVHGNRIHVFADADAADHHVAQYRARRIACPFSSSASRSSADAEDALCRSR